MGSFELLETAGQRLRLSAAAFVLRGFALPYASELMAAIADINANSPFRHMQTPGLGNQRINFTFRRAG